MKRRRYSAILLLVSLLMVGEVRTQPRDRDLVRGLLIQRSPFAESQPEPTPEIDLPSSNISGDNVDAPAATSTVSTEQHSRPSASRMNRPLPLPEASRLSILDKAYIDAYQILREDSKCSALYGGAAAIEVLNQLTSQLKPAYFNRSIGLRMTGQISYATNYQTGLSYRLFAKAELNRSGPFYTTTVVPSNSIIPRVGEFSPNTREARVTILLHELGHMIQTPGGQWVLPNDGDDPVTSKNNTQKVIDICREQIKGRAHVSFEDALAMVMSDSEDNGNQIASAGGPSSETMANRKPFTSEPLRQIGSHRDARCESCRSEIQIPQDH